VKRSENLALGGPEIGLTAKRSENLALGGPEIGLTALIGNRLNSRAGIIGLSLSVLFHGQAREPI
jgi:hypothetical protein